MLKPSLVLAVIATLFLTGCSSTPKGVWSPHGKWSAVTPVEYAEEYCDGYADMAAELSVAGQQVPQPSSPQATRTTYGYDVKAKCFALLDGVGVLIWRATWSVEKATMNFFVAT